MYQQRLPEIKIYIYGDKHGNCTCKNASVVDYCICNGSFVNRFFTF